MTNNYPIVTVVLPVYNAGRFLEATLEGIAKQDYPNIELVIVDDGSSDASDAVYRKWMRANPRVDTIVVINALNLGVCNALRIACERAKGDLIAQIGHDDVWLPNHLTSLKDLLADSEFVAAFSGVEYIDESGSRIDAHIFDHSRISTLSHAALFAELFAGNFLCAPASMFKRSAYSKKHWGLHNERLQDYQLWLSLLLEGPFATAELVTTQYRLHDSNLSSGSTLLLQSQLELFEVQQKILSSGKLFRWLQALAKDSLELSDFLTNLYDSIVQVAGYYPPLQLNFLVFLERLQEDLPTELSVVRHRINFLTRMGALRKALLISKGDRSLGKCGKDGAPILIPANEQADDGLFQFLIETGWFADGRGVDVLARGITDFFFITGKEHLEGSLQYAQFEEAYKRKRVFLTADQRNVTLDSDCRIPKEFRRIGHLELDKMLRWAEDARMLG